MATEKKILGADGVQQMAVEVRNLMNSHNANETAHADIRGDLTELTEKLNSVKPWLIGSTTDTTPAQVADALRAERDVLLTHVDTTYGTNLCTNFIIAETLGYVISSALVAYGSSILMIYVCGNIEQSNWSFTAIPLAQSTDIPIALPNPNALTFTGAVNGTYDGSSALTVDVPAIAGKDGYTPVKGTDYWTTEDRASIVSDVLAILDAPAAVQVVVDEDKNITLSGDLTDNAYTLKYEYLDGGTTEICTLAISDDSGETLTNNLFVASDCTLNKRIKSSGEIVDQDQTFVTDYIDIGDCMASGGTNQIHFRGFIMYTLRTDGSDGTIDSSISLGSTYRAVNYYDDSGTFLGQYADYYREAFVTDDNGDGVIMLDASMTTATKIRVCGAIASADLTSTDQLANCIITLNELIEDSGDNGEGSGSGDSGGDDSGDTGETETPDTTLTWSVGTKLDSSTGVESSSSTYAASNYISIVDGWTYTLAKSGDTAIGAKVCYYDADKTFMSTSSDLLTQGTSAQSVTVPVASGAKYFRIRYYNSNGATADKCALVTLTVAQ